MYKTKTDKIKNPKVAEIFNEYPEPMRTKLLFLRQLILDTASETEEVDKLEETLKWGEPSYLAKTGSTIRIDWKESNIKQYAMYFHCKTKLADTFKKLYQDTFKFEGNRAILFDELEEIPTKELKHCIALALTYHTKQHIPIGE